MGEMWPGSKSLETVFRTDAQYYGHDSLCLGPRGRLCRDAAEPAVPAGQSSPGPQLQVLVRDHGAEVVWYRLRESTSGRAVRIDEVTEHSAPASLIGQQAEGSRTLNRLSPRRRSELSVDRGRLCFHGVHGDEELLCDLLE